MCGSTWARARREHRRTRRQDRVAGCRCRRRRHPGFGEQADDASQGRAGGVHADVPAVPLPNVIVFQYNPETMTHTWTQPDSVPRRRRPARRGNPLAVQGMPGEKFSFTIASTPDQDIADGACRSARAGRGIRRLHPARRAGDAALPGRGRSDRTSCWDGVGRTGPRIEPADDRKRAREHGPGGAVHLGALPDRAGQGRPGSRSPSGSTTRRSTRFTPRPSSRSGCSPRPSSPPPPPTTTSSANWPPSPTRTRSRSARSRALANLGKRREPAHRDDPALRSSAVFAPSTPLRGPAAYHAVLPAGGTVTALVVPGPRATVPVGFPQPPGRDRLDLCRCSTSTPRPASGGCAMPTTRCSPARSRPARSSASRRASG